MLLFSYAYRQTAASFHVTVIDKDKTLSFCTLFRKKNWHNFQVFIRPREMHTV